MDQLIAQAGMKCKISDKTREKLIAGIPTANLNFKLMNLTRYKSESIEGVQLKEMDYNQEAVNYYGLEKYKSWREGRTLHAMKV